MTHPLQLTDDKETPLAETVLRDALWTLESSPPDMPSFWGLDTLRELTHQFETVREQAVSALPRTLKSRVRLAGFTQPNPFRFLSASDERFRQICILDVALFGLNLALDMLEHKPPAAIPKLAKVRRHL